MTDNRSIEVELKRIADSTVLTTPINLRHHIVECVGVLIVLVVNALVEVVVAELPKVSEDLSN